MSRPAGALRWIESTVLLLPLRLALGGLFLFASWVKLFSRPFADKVIENPAQDFADSIKAFKIFPVEGGGQVITLLTFTVPWAEAICGVLLILGLWTRAASTLLAAMLLAFTVGILSVIFRQLEVECGCFGEYDWPCVGAMGWCHVWRDVVMLAAALLLVWRGSGTLGLDYPAERRAGRSPGARRVDPDEDEA